MQEISEYFVAKYIDNSDPIDNQIFLNIPENLFKQIIELFSNKKDIKSLSIILDKSFQDYYEKIENQTDNTLLKKVLANCYIDAIILEELINKHTNILSNNKLDNEFINLIKNGIISFKESQLNNAINYYYKAPSTLEINNILNTNKIEEIVLMCKDIDNILIQQTINSKISSRTKQSYKIFSNREKLSTYYDTAGNIIQSPHDYLNQNINHFINYKQNPSM